MQFAKATFGLSIALLLGGTVGVLGSWALPGGAVVLLISACAAAVAMEERDFATQGTFDLAAASLLEVDEPSTGELPIAA